MVELWLRQEGLDAAGARPRLQRRAGQPAVRPRVPGGREADRVDGRLRRRPEALPARQRLVARCDRARLRGASADGWLAQHGAAADRGIRDRAAAVADRHRAPWAPRARRSRSAVPLLDESHLQIDRSPERAEAERAGGGRRPRRWSRRCCCGSSATSGRGSCSVHVWDVGHLTGLAARPLPAHPHRPAHRARPRRPAGLLDELADRIRRVHTRVLVGRAPVAARRWPRRRRPRPSRGSSRCSSATARRCARRTAPASQRVLRGGLAVRDLS